MSDLRHRLHRAAVEAEAFRRSDVADLFREADARVGALEAAAERLRSLLRTLLGMHDAEVFVREPWDTAFNEVRAALAGEGDEP